MPGGAYAASAKVKSRKPSFDATPRKGSRACQGLPLFTLLKDTSFGCPVCWSKSPQSLVVSRVYAYPLYEKMLPSCTMLPFAFARPAGLTSTAPTSSVDATTAPPRPAPRAPNVPE
jgi:hypothetical protein